MLCSSFARGRPTAKGVENEPPALGASRTIRDVWASNLAQEFETIACLVQTHNYVAMDTEFPGVLVRPDNNELKPSAYQYALVRDNVNLMKLIQLGFSFLNENGKPAPNCSTWQFHFKFSLQKDAYADGSIVALTESGIQFEKHERDGIDPRDFAHWCTTSGIVCSDHIKWLVFYGAYDFGYLLKVLTGQNLPREESKFLELLPFYFPAIYDIKCLMKSCPSLRGGLQNVANALQVERVGSQHQAGSDSMLTGAVFFKMRKVYFGGTIDDRYCGQVSGLGGVSFILYGSTWYNTVPFSSLDFQDDLSDAEPKDPCHV